MATKPAQLSHGYLLAKNITRMSAQGYNIETKSSHIPNAYHY
jgi:hypothetical protein